MRVPRMNLSKGTEQQAHVDLCVNLFPCFGFHLVTVESDLSMLACRAARTGFDTRTPLPMHIPKIKQKYTPNPQPNPIHLLFTGPPRCRRPRPCAPPWPAAQRAPAGPAWCATCPRPRRTRSGGARCLSFVGCVFVRSDGNGEMRFYGRNLSTGVLVLGGLGRSCRASPACPNKQTPRRRRHSNRSNFRVRT